jgi:hypothetical protein
MTQRETLEGALNLLRRGPTSRANAVDARGKACRVLDPDAVAWSLYGGLLHQANLLGVDAIPF